MKKTIYLDENKSNALAKMIAAGGAGTEALRELFTKAEAELRDVLNIDPKGNMGLQSLASQRAFETLQEIRKQVFPGQAVVQSGESKKEEQPRPYR